MTKRYNRLVSVLERCNHTGRIIEARKYSLADIHREVVAMIRDTLAPAVAYDHRMSFADLMRKGNPTCKIKRARADLAARARALGITYRELEQATGIKDSSWCMYYTRHGNNYTPDSWLKSIKPAHI